MIYAELTGGLGNQMFVYAFARALSLRCREPMTLIDRQDWQGGAPVHTVCALGALRIPPEVRILPGGDYAKRHLPLQNALKAGMIRREQAGGMMARDWHPFEAKAAPWLNRLGLHFVTDGYIPCRRGPGRHLLDLLAWGYFQGEAYFADFRDAIRAELRPAAAPDPDMAAAIAAAGVPVCLHIRRYHQIRRLHLRKAALQHFIRVMPVQIPLKSILGRKVLTALIHPEKRRSGHQRGHCHKQRKHLRQQSAALPPLFHQNPPDQRINLLAPDQRRQPPEAAEHQIYIPSQGKRKSRIIPERHIEKLFTEEATGKLEHSSHYVSLQKNKTGTAVQIPLQNKGKNHGPESPHNADRKKQVAASAAVLPEHKTTPDRFQNTSDHTADNIDPENIIK